MSEQDSDLAPDVPAAPAHEYSNFIQQLEISTIFLQSAHVENKVGPVAPTPAEVSIQGKSSFNNGQGTVRVAHIYEVHVHDADDPDKIFLELEVQFAVDYRSQLSMTPALFMTFKDLNLPLNTWPYLREYLASTMTRCNWVPFTLPVFSVPGSSAPTPTRTPRKRKAKAIESHNAS